MASANFHDQLGQVLIDFSTNGAFPEEEAVSAAYIQKPLLAPALAALGTARAELEVGVLPQFRLSAKLGTLKLTWTFRQRSGKSVVIALPMSTPGSSMQNLYRMTSNGQSDWQALSSGRRRQMTKQ
jgi:hypothetical protein